MQMTNTIVVDVTYILLQKHVLASFTFCTFSTFNKQRTWN